MDFPFDYVELDEQGRKRRLEAQEFFDLPLSIRVAHVIGRSVRFFFSNGAEVDRHAALARIRTMRLAG